MRTPEEVLAAVERRLASSWARVACGEPWKPAFPLGTAGVSGSAAAAAWTDTFDWVLGWRDWMRALDDELVQAGEPGAVVLRSRDVSVRGSAQPLPTALEIATPEAAARLLGDAWVDRVARGRRRAAVLREAFPDHPAPARVVKRLDGWDEEEFALLLTVATWFRDEPPTGAPPITTRQVPVPGLGTKWLTPGRAALVADLAGIAVTDGDPFAALGLVPGRAPRFHLTYLDPAHLAAGGRRHDLVTLGDRDVVAYRPRVVVISENRDTAEGFPALAGGIAIEGEGRGASAIASVAWVQEAPWLFYWGDLDADGLEILHEFRAAGLPVRSLLMDGAAHDRWGHLGIDRSADGSPLTARTPRHLPLLEPGERALYERLCGPAPGGPRRVEQEKIPVAAAVAAMEAAGLRG